MDQSASTTRAGQLNVWGALLASLAKPAYVLLPFYSCSYAATVLSALAQVGGVVCVCVCAPRVRELVPGPGTRRGR